MNCPSFLRQPDFPQYGFISCSGFAKSVGLVGCVGLEGYIGHFRIGSWWLRIAILICLILTFQKQVDAQGPKIEASINTDSIFVGETIDLQIEVKNIEDPQPPDITALQELFEIESLGNESRNQASTFIINGRVSQRNIFSHIYAYRLTPKSAGRLTIPSVTCTAEGRELKSNSMTVEVLEAEVQDVVIIETIPSRRTLFPTQSFSVTMKLLVKPLPDSERDPLQEVRRPPPQLTIGWIEPPEGLQADALSDFLRSKLSKAGIGFTLNDYRTQGGSLFDSPRKAVFDLRNGRETRDDLNGSPVNYFVYELTRSFTAERPGMFLFDGASVKGVFVSGQSNGDFQGRRIVAVSPSASVDVKDVPNERPKNFIGGIGQYSVTAVASPTKLRVGDPLTLSLEFDQSKQGGSLDLISAPNLEAMEELIQDFEIVDSKPTGRIDGSSKKFSFALRPKRAGVNLPALRISSFDPERESFTEMQTSPIPLEVSEASSLGNSEIVGTLQKGNSNTIKSNQAGIFGNITDPFAVQNDLPTWAVPMTLIATFWSLSIAGAVIVILGRKADRSPVQQRRQRASRNAIASLQNAKRLAQQPKEAGRQIRLSIVGLIADYQGIRSDGMTKSDVDSALVRSGVTDADKREVLGLLDELDSWEYGSGREVSPLQTIERAEMLVKRISPALGKSKLGKSKLTKSKLTASGKERG